jgi:sensor domain CHASE-containing protein
MPLRPATTHRRSRIGLVVWLTVIFAVVAAVFLVGLYQSATKSDEIFAERQAREIRQAISNGLDSMAQAQQGAAVWDPLVIELNRPAPDWTWVDENVGQWLHRLFGHDRVYILGPDDTVRYGYVDGSQISLPNHAALEPAISALVRLARGVESRAPNQHERLPAREPTRQNTLRTTPPAVHATDLGTISGRPAAISAMRILPMTGEAPQPPPGREHLLVSVMFLDGVFLQNLARDNLIDDPHFHSAGAGNGHEDEYATTIRSADGTPLGHVTWRPELP